MPQRKEYLQFTAQEVRNIMLLLAHYADTYGKDTLSLSDEMQGTLLKAVSIVDLHAADGKMLGSIRPFTLLGDR